MRACLSCAQNLLTALTSPKLKAGVQTMAHRSLSDIISCLPHPLLPPHWTWEAHFPYQGLCTWSSSCVGHFLQISASPPQLLWVFAQISLSHGNLTWPLHLTLDRNPSKPLPFPTDISSPYLSHFCLCLSVVCMLLGGRGFACFILC